MGQRTTVTKAPGSGVPLVCPEDVVRSTQRTREALDKAGDDCGFDSEMWEAWEGSEQRSHRSEKTAHLNEE